MPGFFPGDLESTWRCGACRRRAVKAVLFRVCVHGWVRVCSLAFERALTRQRGRQLPILRPPKRFGFGGLASACARRVDKVVVVEGPELDATRREESAHLIESSGCRNDQVAATRTRAPEGDVLIVRQRVHPQKGERKGGLGLRGPCPPLATLTSWIGSWVFLALRENDPPVRCSGPLLLQSLLLCVAFSQTSRPHFLPLIF